MDNICAGQNKLSSHFRVGHGRPTCTTITPSMPSVKLDKGSLLDRSPIARSAFKLRNHEMWQNRLLHKSWLRHCALIVCCWLFVGRPYCGDFHFGRDMLLDLVFSMRHHLLPQLEKAHLQQLRNNISVIQSSSSCLSSSSSSQIALHCSGQGRERRKQQLMRIYLFDKLYIVKIDE